MTARYTFIVTKWINSDIIASSPRGYYFYLDSYPMTNESIMNHLETLRGRRDGCMGLRTYVCVINSASKKKKIFFSHRMIMYTYDDSGPTEDVLPHPPAGNVHHRLELSEMSDRDGIMPPDGARPGDPQRSCQHLKTSS